MIALKPTQRKIKYNFYTCIIFYLTSSKTIFNAMESASCDIEVTEENGMRIVYFDYNESML